MRISNEIKEEKKMAKEERKSYCYSREGVQCRYFLLSSGVAQCFKVGHIIAQTVNGSPIAVPAWCPLLKVEGRE